AVVVAPDRGRNRTTAVHVAAGHRATLVVRVHGDREDELAARIRRSTREPRTSFVHVPAVVRERADELARAEVDLLPRALADVRDVEIACRAVEREAPRVPEPVRDGLPARAPLERVEAHQLAEVDGERLRAVSGIAARPAVPHPDPEQAVG